MNCPGHGDAVILDQNQLNFEGFANRLVDLMDQLNHKSAILGGISMGAGIAINIALRFPERVKGLVLVRPAWLDRKSPENLQILVEAAKLINDKAAFQQLPKFQSINTTLPKAAQSILGVFAPTQQPDIGMVLDALVKDRPFNDLNELKDLKVPSLIIGNENDPLHPFSMALKMSQAIRGSQLHQVTSRYIDDQVHRREVNQIVHHFLTQYLE